jgi:hypothetical protein
VQRIPQLELELRALELFPLCGAETKRTRLRHLGLFSDSSRQALGQSDGIDRLAVPADLKPRAQRSSPVEVVPFGTEDSLKNGNRLENIRSLLVSDDPMLMSESPQAIPPRWSPHTQSSLS